MPGFDFILTSLCGLSDDEILALEAAFLATTFLLFKHKGEKDYLLKHAEELFIFVERTQGSGKTDAYIQIVLIYILRAFGLKKQELDEVVKKIPIKMEAFVSSWDMAVAEGEVKGEVKGRLKEKIREVLRFMRLFPEYAPEQIAVLVEQPLDFVLQVKAAVSSRSLQTAVKSLSRMFDNFTTLRQEDLDELAAMVKKYARSANH